MKSGVMMTSGWMMKARQIRGVFRKMAHSKYTEICAA